MAQMDLLGQNIFGVFILPPILQIKEEEKVKKKSKLPYRKLQTNTGNIKMSEVSTRDKFLESIKEEKIKDCIDETKKEDNKMYLQNDEFVFQLKELKYIPEWQGKSRELMLDLLRTYVHGQYLAHLFVKYAEEEDEFKTQIEYCEVILKGILKETNSDIYENDVQPIFQKMIIDRCHNIFVNEPGYRDGYFISKVAEITGCSFEAASVICRHVRRNHKGRFLDRIICRSYEIDNSIVKLFDKSEINDFFCCQKRLDFLLRICLACCYDYAKDYRGDKCHIYQNFLLDTTFNYQRTLERTYFGVLL